MWNLTTRAPVTTCSWLVLLAVYLATHGLSDGPGRSLSQRTRAWGGVEQLNWVQVEGSKVEVIDPELYGPFDLWDGEWWRVPVSALHHVNLLHLLMNLSFVVLCGPWLEQRWGGSRYAAFLVGAALVSMPGEFLLGQTAVGYSGVCCAILGALLVLRQDDPDLQERMPEDFVIWTMAGLVIMVVLSWADVVRIANVAHFSGLAYGWATATVCRSDNRRRVLWVAGHAALVVPYWFVVHPLWLGRYQWYLADLEQRQQQDGAVETRRLQTAVALDPTLSRVWRMLADDALQRGDTHSAWDCLLRGLQHNPSDAAQWNSARKFWRFLAAAGQREAATRLVQERFGSDAALWLREFRRLIAPPVLIGPDRPPEPTRRVAEGPTIPERMWEPPPAEVWPPRNLPPSGVLPPVDAADHRSAVEGELL